MPLRRKNVTQGIVRIHICNVKKGVICFLGEIKTVHKNSVKNRRNNEMQNHLESESRMLHQLFELVSCPMKRNLIMQYTKSCGDLTSKNKLIGCGKNVLGFHLSLVSNSGKVENFDLGVVAAAGK